MSIAISKCKLLIYSERNKAALMGVGYFWQLEENGKVIAQSVGEFTQTDIENFAAWVAGDLGIPWEYAPDGQHPSHADFS